MIPGEREAEKRGKRAFECGGRSLPGLSDGHPGNADDGSVDDYVFCYFFFHQKRYSGGDSGFGINSGAYVAEIVRGGIMSVDQGQMEAGRSLGMNYKTDHASHCDTSGDQKYSSGPGK